jgi:flagellar hook-associated protein 2
MSVNPTSSFNFDGVVSGLNTSSIIQKMMSMYQAPVTALQNQQSDIQARDKAYQAIKAQVSSFQTALKTLLQPSNVNAKTTTSSTTGVATATSNSDAINGSFGLSVTRLATATALGSAAPISLGVDDGATSGAKLNVSGLSTAVTAGNFTINGVSISVDPATDTLADVVNRINTQTAGAAGNVGVTATLVNDANGHPNFIQLTPNAGNTSAIQLGSVSDTSNFLMATHLVATGVTGGGPAGAVTSNAPLSSTQTGANLSTGRFSAGSLDASGSFTINGTTINWSNGDSLATVLNRINTSNAGVRAAYDATSDKVTLTNVSTGNQTMTLSDSAPAAGKIGFLQALGLNTSNQVVGQTAQYQVTQNGVPGPVLYSNSNSISNVVAGVSVTLTGTGNTTIGVAQDTSTAVGNVQKFVSAFNSLVDLIDQDTAYDATKNQAGVLTGDPGIQALEGQLRTLVSSAAPGVGGQYTSLSNLGISTGAVGSAVGTTNHLTVDSGKLTAALQNNPSAVLSVFGGTATGTLNPDGSGNPTTGAWISSLAGTPTGQFGTYKLSIDSTGAITSVFTPVGGTSLAAVSGTLTGGANTSLIAGMTITSGALPPAGTTWTDTVSVGGSGVLGRLDAFLTSALGTQGVFQTESDSAQSEVQGLTNRINDMNVQLAQQQQTLQAQFTAMETALAQINAQGGSLMASMGSSMPSASAPSSSSGSSSSAG